MCPVCKPCYQTHQTTGNGAVRPDLEKGGCCMVSIRGGGETHSGCYNFFPFLSALIWNSKFPVRKRYLWVNILSILNRITDWSLSCNVQEFLFGLKLRFALSSNVSKLKVFEGKVVLMKVFLIKDEIVSYLTLCLRTEK